MNKYVALFISCTCGLPALVCAQNEYKQKQLERIENTIDYSLQSGVLSKEPLTVKSSPEGFKAGRLIVRDRNSLLFGFVDKSGKNVIPCSFKSTSPFTQTEDDKRLLSYVKRLDNENRVLGYWIDIDGKTVGKVTTLKHKSPSQTPQIPTPSYPNYPPKRPEF